ncbi:complement factor H-like [Cololabis saira]|uniref:complement factor H-like n=1 Tax=Cololabis saira TaxID=129043 RepID=UPI002AD4DAA2|nr:complement factor H-like [Cololabis saira]
MQMGTKTCVLLLWIQTLSFVKCQKCTVQQFKESSDYDLKFDTTVLEPEYTNGKQVRVPCISGYTGFFKLTCVGPHWRTTGSKCQAKSCGHPGDAQFADFHLESGDDFVFGSKVVYTCQNGFQMVSRTNYRRCMAEGWDGNVPVCEAQRCPLIHPSNKVQVIGDHEEASFGNVIRFSCKSSNQILDGANEIYCNENGEWSGEVPDCRDITCDTPVIEHGSVRDAPREYKENEILNFDCGNDYKRTDERFPTCIKVGGKATWSPTPGCKLKTCELELQTGRGTTYIPSNTNVFLPGSTLQVKCGRKHWIVDSQTTTADVTCKSNGEWSIRPVCKEVICSDPQDNAVDRFSVYWGGRKLDQTAEYSCRAGFEPRGTTTATCTRAGWRPDPLCKRTWCSKPDLENARITGTWNNRNVYSSGDSLGYTCINGDDRTFTLTCNEGSWTGLESCSAVKPCIKPVIENGFAIGPVDDVASYSCHEGFKLFTKAWWGVARCNKGSWPELTQCIENSQCGEAPEILKGKTTLNNNGYPQSLRIECDEGYHTQTSDLTCVQGEWDLKPNHICIAVADLCEAPPKVENAIVTTPYQMKYLSGSTVTYQCRDTFVMEGKETIRCRDGEWEKTNIICNAQCERLQDEKLRVENLPMDKELYKNGEVIEYVCNAHDAGDRNTATCVDGQWTKTVECPGIPCTVGEMDPGLSIEESPVNGKVKAGEKLLFQCSDPYVLQGSQEIECLDTGEWSSPFPTCSETCQIQGVPQILYITEPIPNNELMKGQTVTFACRRSGEFIQGNETLECLANRRLSGPFPTCNQGPSGCQKPPSLADGDVKESMKPEYDHNERVEYICQRYHIMEGTGQRTCVNGAWTGEIKCLKPCTVNQRDMDERNIRFAVGRGKKMYAEHEDHITFVCKRAGQVSSLPLRQQCVDGVMDLPTCRDQY